ncbi:MAG: hypothetical protein ACK5MY_02475 [Jhaorihella sp.]
MACAGCAARRRRIREAAKQKRLGKLVGEVAKGAAEITGLKAKTALQEDAADQPVTPDALVKGRPIVRRRPPR